MFLSILQVATSAIFAQQAISVSEVYFPTHVPSAFIVLKVLDTTQYLVLSGHLVIRLASKIKATVHRVLEETIVKYQESLQSLENVKKVGNLWHLKLVKGYNRQCSISSSSFNEFQVQI